MMVNLAQLCFPSRRSGVTFPTIIPNIDSLSANIVIRHGNRGIGFGFSQPNFKKKLVILMISNQNSYFNEIQPDHHVRWECKSLSDPRLTW